MFLPLAFTDAQRNDWVSLELSQIEEGKKEGRKQRRKEGRKEGRKGRRINNVRRG
jgi:hypothetical protein